jgi:cytochrome c oxidase subunit 2
MTSTVSFWRYVPATPAKRESQRQKPSRPSRASVRVKSKERPETSKSRPATCGTPFTYTSNDAPTCGGRSTFVSSRSTRSDTLVECHPAVRKLSTLLACAAGALVLASSASASYGGIGPVDPVSPNGEKAASAYWLVFALTAGIFILVEGALVLFAVRFRSRGRARTEEGPDIHGSTKLETAWTILPIVLLAIIATFVFVNLPGYVHPAKAEEANALRIHVIGHQFYWEFRYADGTLAFDQMVVPENKLVLLTVDSADVNHSWWIPAFGPKSDAIPGQTNHAWFKVTPNSDVPFRVFKGQCAELCGYLHAKMSQTVKVLPQADYAAWHQQQAALTGAALGKQEFAASCAKCHGAQAQGFIGPTLAGSSLVTDPKALEPILRDGRATMPPVGNGWTQEEVSAVIAYFKSNPFHGGSSGQ